MMSILEAWALSPVGGTIVVQEQQRRSCSVGTTAPPSIEMHMFGAEL